ncbi:MAG: bifunctional methylenetetrahydrofolate dehydrogenase/methenyltetrahydrofolate cyclohydrolase FolD [Candidatus Methylacidiphilales bacterium]
MSAQLINGKAIAEQIHQETRQRVAALQSRGIQPAIVFIRVGEDPASRAYVGMKDKQAAALGLLSRTHVLPVATTQAELLTLIDSLNADPSVHGILVQAPLPSPISETAVFSRVDPRKDVDGFHPLNVGKLLLGDPTGFRPCTPAGVQELLIRSHIPTAGAFVAILGRGNIVGKPLAAILCQKSSGANATLCLIHSASRDVPALTRQADIVVAAMGRAEFIRGDHIKPGATVIDVGVNRIEDPNTPKGYRLVGDIAFEEVCQVAAYVTPNPGGVGPMTIAMLMANTVTAAEKLTA